MRDNQSKPLMQGAAGDLSRMSFRQRYDELERQRSVAIERLNRLGAPGRAHPSFRKAMRLLNQTFRKSSIVQRVAILQAANWLINLIELGSWMA